MSTSDDTHEYGIIRWKSGVTGVQHAPRAASSYRTVECRVSNALENDEGGRVASSYRTLECRDCVGKIMKGGEPRCHIVRWNVELVTRWRMMMGGEMRESEKCKVKKYCSIQLTLPLPPFLALRRSASPVSTHGKRGVFYNGFYQP